MADFSSEKLLRRAGRAPGQTGVGGPGGPGLEFTGPEPYARRRADHSTPEAAMTTVETTTPADGVTLLTLNRPERLNALDYELVTELHRAIDAIRDDPDCRVVVITGAGRGFCAGLDLRGFGRVPGTEQQGRAQQGMAVQQHIARLVPQLRSLRQPVIAAVNGPAAGGGLAIALASDIRLASTSASFATSFVRLGISGCDIGISWMLPRLIGASRAWELMLTGRRFDVAEAEALGLVTRVVDDGPTDDGSTADGSTADGAGGGVVGEALRTAELIKANSPMGVWMTKEVMWSNLEVGSLQAGIDLENRTQILCSSTEDSRRAMEGFLGGEAIEWQNR